VSEILDGVAAMSIEARRDVCRREVVELSGVRVIVDEQAYDPNIVQSLRARGYESGERSVLPKLLSSQDRVLEVGSALGCVSMVAAKIVGAENILTFEANPLMVAAAERNFELNALPISIRNGVLQNRICWDGPGQSTQFHIHREFWASSLVKSKNTVKSIEVPTYCFEEEVSNWRANVLICDIEGGEIDLLSYADLTAFNKILLEIHYWAGREGINKLIRKLIMDGFSVNFDLSFRSIVCLHRGLTVPA